MSSAVTTLEVSAICSVKWSDKKTYKATVLAIGDLKSMREEERKHGSDDENSMNTVNTKNTDENLNTINTQKSRKRTTNTASLPPPKKKKSGANKKSPKQSKNFFALEVALPPPNDKPPNDPNHTATVSNSTTNPNPTATSSKRPIPISQLPGKWILRYMKGMYMYMYVIIWKIFSEIIFLCPNASDWSERYGCVQKTWFVKETHSMLWSA